MTGYDHENRGYRRLFDGAGLTFGAGFPLTGVAESTPDPIAEARLASHAEAVGFDGLWARDVPTYWPRFGDAGGAFDPWSLLSTVAGHTDDIALGTSSVVLPPPGPRGEVGGECRPTLGRTARPRGRLRRPRPGVRGLRRRP